MEDVSKLPKWAQARIARLDRNVESLNAQIAAMSSESNTIYWEYLMEKHGLPDNISVTFVLPSGDVEARVVSGGWLSVRSHRAMIVKPGASNAVYVKNEED